MLSIDLNCDLGESFGAYTTGHDAGILPFISSANIACGFHAGDPLVIKKTIETALENGVSVGAHPGFPDLQGFGRRTMVLSEEELFSCVLYQVCTLKGMTEAMGGHLHHVKPHGALYNMAAKDFSMAQTIARAVQTVDPELYFMGLANSELLNAAQSLGLKTISEAFADRSYTADGHLTPRSRPGAVIHDRDRCIRQVLDIVHRQNVTSADGHTVVMQAQSICLHGDNSAALELAKAINQALRESDILIQPLNA